MCAYAPRVRRGRVLAMLKCYSDESGCHEGDDSNLFVLAGYLLEEINWEHFAEEWDAQLARDFPIDFFHMADAEYGDGVFAGIREEFRQRKVKDLAEVIWRYRPVPVAVSLDKRDYDRIVRGAVRPDCDSPYALLLYQLMRGICEFQKRRATVHGRECEPVEFVFDRQLPEEFRVLSWYEGLCEVVPEPIRTILSNTPVFRDDRKILPLQAADMLAWHVRREVEFPAEERSLLGMITVGAPAQWRGRLGVDVMHEWRRMHEEHSKELESTREETTRYSNIRPLHGCRADDDESA
jgi:Protein of unknown function (DUF3800)